MHMYMYVQWETNFQHKISALCQKMTIVLSQQPARNSGVDSVDGNTASLEMQRYMHMYMHICYTCFVHDYYCDRCGSDQISAQTILKSGGMRRMCTILLPYILYTVYTCIKCTRVSLLAGEYWPNCVVSIAV